MWLSTALWVVCCLSLEGFGQSSAALVVIDKFTIIGSPGWTNGTSSITNDTGSQMFAVSMNLFKRLDLKIMVNKAFYN
jgi:hypothetical protein